MVGSYIGPNSQISHRNLWCVCIWQLRYMSGGGPLFLTLPFAINIVKKTMSMLLLLLNGIHMNGNAVCVTIAFVIDRFWAILWDQFFRPLVDQIAKKLPNLSYLWTNSLIAWMWGKVLLNVVDKFLYSFSFHVHKNLVFVSYLVRFQRLWVNHPTRGWPWGCKAWIPIQKDLIIMFIMWIIAFKSTFSES